MTFSTHVNYHLPESTVGTPALELVVEWEYEAGQQQTHTDPGFPSDSSLTSITLEDSNGNPHDITEMLCEFTRDAIFELAMAPE